MIGLLLVSFHSVYKKSIDFFRKWQRKDGIPPLLSKLKINNYEIKQRESIKFLCILLDYNFTCKLHIKYIKITLKNIS